MMMWPRAESVEFCRLILDPGYRRGCVFGERGLSVTTTKHTSKSDINRNHNAKFSTISRKSDM